MTYQPFSLFFLHRFFCRSSICNRGVQLIASHIALWIFLLVWVGASACSKFGPRELTKLPAAPGREMLDTSQAQYVFNFARRCPNETQISLCIVSGESEKYVGIVRRHDSLLYVDNCDSVFGIGSITKTFTGTMLAKLVYDGKADLNEPIKNLLPVHLNQSSLNGKEITLVDLANHTSGLPFEPANVRDDQEHPYNPVESVPVL